MHSLFIWPTYSGNSLRLVIDYGAEVASVKSFVDKIPSLLPFPEFMYCCQNFNFLPRCMACTYRPPLHTLLFPNLRPPSPPPAPPVWLSTIFEDVKLMSGPLLGLKWIWLAHLAAVSPDLSDCQQKILVIFFLDFASSDFGEKLAKRIKLCTSSK